jgi:hypothetical protein
VVADDRGGVVTIKLDGIEYRRVQHYDHTYWCFEQYGVTQWFDNTDDTIMSARQLAVALDRLEAIDALVSEKRGLDYFGYDDIGYNKADGWDSFCDEVKGLLHSKGGHK